MVHTHPTQFAIGLARTEFQIVLGITFFSSSFVISCREISIFRQSSMLNILNTFLESSFCSNHKK